jgi:hypothetical protein
MIIGEENKLSFTLPNGSIATLHCDAEKFSDSTKFVILSGGYSIEAEAIEYASKLKNAVLCFGTKFRLGIDVGKDKTSSCLSQYVKDKIFDEHSVRMIDDVHGITVYSEEHVSSCISMSAVLLVNSRTSDFFTEEICNILSQELKVNSRIQMAMELLTSSYFEASPRARFLTLILAAESILCPEDRSLKVKELIDNLREHTENSDITPEEKQSLLGSLDWLYKDSITLSLKKMGTNHLQGKIYDGLPAEKFIKKCYEARSKLVHTGSIDNSKYNIGTLAANLEVYMTDMLTTISYI